MTRNMSSTLQSLPPMETPSNGRTADMNETGGLGSSMSSTMNGTWHNPVSTPSLGGSATLSGGWNLQGRFPPTPKRLSTADVTVRLEQETLVNDRLVRTPMTDQAFPGTKSFGSKERSASQPAIIKPVDKSGSML